MKTNKCKIVLISFLLLNAFTWSTLIRITGLKCHVVDPSFCRFENCVMKPVRRGVKEISMVVKLLQLPVTNASLRVEIFRREYSTQTLYQFEIDCCKFMVSKRRNPFAKAIYKFLQLETHSNVNHTCPYNHDLIIDHLQLDKNLNLHLPIGMGEYVMKMYWKIYNVLRGTVHFTLQISD